MEEYALTLRRYRHYGASDFSRLLFDESITPAEILRCWRGRVDAGDNKPPQYENSLDYDNDNEEKEEDDDNSFIPKYDYDVLE